MENLAVPLTSNMTKASRSGLVFVYINLVFVFKLRGVFNFAVQMLLRTAEQFICWKIHKEAHSFLLNLCTFVYL